jgi:hypothetical protein
VIYLAPIDLLVHEKWHHYQTNWLDVVSKFFPLHHCVAMSAAGHSDAGNVTQDDIKQAHDDYNDGLDNFHQTAA